MSYRVYLATDNGITSAIVKANDRTEAVEVVKKYKGESVHILSIQKLRV